MSKQRLILRINLNDESVSIEPLAEEYRQKYLGGEGVNARLLWEHFLTIDPKIDPLSPDNVLIAGVGPLAGTGLGAGSKMKFTYKSPAYNIYGDASCGGGLGSQLRWAGYDHMIITGKAKRPVYLWINDDSIEIRDASHLWGKDTHKTEDAVREDLGDKDIAIACIGQAGENLVRVASIILDGHRAAARGGGGCVFGSKNLKAIVARGTKGLDIHDAKALFKVMDDFGAATNKNIRARERAMKWGTLGNTRLNHTWGFNAFRNMQGYIMPDEGADKLDHKWYINNIATRALACSPGCAFGCGGWYQLKGHESESAARYAGERSTKPEYGTANPFGTACDVRDMPAVGHFNKMCNQYGMDTMEIGMSISLLMELWQRGVITAEDTADWYGEPLSLEWGNDRAVEGIIDAIGLKQNRLGEIMRGGVYQTALRIGELKGMDLLKYANYGKGGATHEGPARGLPTLGIACALAPIGAHHLKGMGISPGASIMYFEKPDAADIMGGDLKGAGHAVAENFMALCNSLGICSFLAKDPAVIPIELFSAALEAVAGISLTPEDLYIAAQRVANIEKAFNSRLGLRREHDALCERWMNEPIMEGRAFGIKAGDFLEPAKDEYYQHRGWDKNTSLQTREKLAELDMIDVADILEKENAVIG
ncbi:aldehyde ferredoxin oxidoreductase family protein [Thermodesulfobacteriota bacterium]